MATSIALGKKQQFFLLFPKSVIWDHRKSMVYSKSQFNFQYPSNINTAKKKLILIALLMIIIIWKIMMTIIWHHDHNQHHDDYHLIPKKFQHHDDHHSKSLSTSWWSSFEIIINIMRIIIRNIINIILIFIWNHYQHHEDHNLKSLTTSWWSWFEIIMNMIIVPSAWPSGGSRLCYEPNRPKQPAQVCHMMIISR